MGDSGVAKVGDILVQNRGIRKSMQKKFCVLHRKTADAHPFIEVYESKKAFEECKTAGKKCEKKIDLQHVRGLYKTIQSSSKGNECLLAIHVKHNKNVLGFSSEAEVNDWERVLRSIVDICPDKGQDEGSSSSLPEPGDDEVIVTENLMYETAEKATMYDVTVQDTPLAKMCELVGKRTLLISAHDLALQHPTTRVIQYSWPFATIRRYGMKRNPNVFLFECGRKCNSGEGHIHCESNSYKEIHDYVTDKARCAASRGYGAGEPVRRVQSTEVKTEQNLRNSKGDKSPTIPSRDYELEEANAGPALILNVRGNHPKAKGMTLVPLPNVHATSSSQPERHPQRDMRFSAKTHKEVEHSASDERHRTASLSSMNSAKASEARHRAPANYEFVKDLEGKLQHPEEHDSIQIKPARPSKKDKRVSKEEKEEKEEKKPNVLSQLFSKKKSKERPKAPEPEAAPVVDTGLYEDAESLPLSSPTRTVPNAGERIYDEAVSEGDQKIPPRPGVEYAQPYARKGGNPVPVPEPVMYSDAKDVRANAWRSHGRTEMEECHEEDYSNIREAREEAKQNPSMPPVPQRGYLQDSDNESEEDTYDRLDHSKHTQRAKGGDPNIYGTASARPVPQNIYGMASGRTVEQTYESVSGEEELSSNEEEEVEYEGIDETAGQQEPQDGYEETAVPPRKPVRPTPPPVESLYEEVR